MKKMKNLKIMKSMKNLKIVKIPDEENLCFLFSDDIDILEMNKFRIYFENEVILQNNKSF